jgi:acyl-CoA oxidase
LNLFANEEQRKKWLPEALQYNIHGCYVQTEIGHGSDVSRLETTATFDKEKDEFVIDTPTISATKWWPGELGRWSNYAVLFARLIIEEDGEKNDYGIAPFLVQLRCRDTHKYMPGIEAGDLGPKLGYAGKDNGWLTLNKVRVPRSQLLQKFLEVDRDGSVSI